MIEPLDRESLGMVLCGQTDCGCGQWHVEWCGLTQAEASRVLDVLQDAFVPQSDAEAKEVGRRQEKTARGPGFRLTRSQEPSGYQHGRR